MITTQHCNAECRAVARNGSTVFRDNRQATNSPKRRFLFLLPEKTSKNSPPATERCTQKSERSTKKNERSYKKTEHSTQKCERSYKKTEHWTIKSERSYKKCERWTKISGTFDSKERHFLIKL